MRMTHVRAICAVAALLMMAKGTESAWADSPTVVMIERAWASSGTTYDNTDSLAACRVSDGKVRLFATSKEGNRIDVFDASTGEHLQAVGTTGMEAGQFARPNGIVTADLPTGQGDKTKPVILVVERDNHRVQAICPETYKTIGLFGDKELHRPYGCTIAHEGSGVVLFVTDTEVAPNETVKVFELRLNGETVEARLSGAFGETKGPGRILAAESIVADETFNRLLICDEDDEAHPVKVYDMHGKFTGETFGGGLVKGDPEGIVVLAGGENGLVFLTDQRDKVSIWYVFDRKNYGVLAAFTGDPVVANTDGICLYEKGFKAFPEGGMFVVDDDADIHAFQLNAIRKKIGKKAS